jgi:hypothetical protein
VRDANDLPSMVRLLEEGQIRPRRFAMNRDISAETDEKRRLAGLTTENVGYCG